MVDKRLINTTLDSVNSQSLSDESSLLKRYRTFPGMSEVGPCHLLDDTKCSVSKPTRIGFQLLIRISHRLQTEHNVAENLQMK